MNRTLLALLVATSVGGAAAGGVACSSSKNQGSAGSDSGTAETSVTVDAGFAVQLACTDSQSAVYADPGDVSGKPKGAILACQHDTDMTAAAMYTFAQTVVAGAGPAYAGRAFTSGAHIYRVLYRTERGDTNNTPGYSSALVLIPDTPRASTLPVVVASHGSRGQAGGCAPSLLSTDDDTDNDFVNLVFSLAGNGYAVIAPDLAGYANFGGANNPPSVYAGAADVAKSTLDAVQALRNMVPTESLTQDVVITGHSQGGHTALSALSMASSYGLNGNIVGVAVYSPLWISQHAWGAIFLIPSDYGFAESSAGAVSLWYHYTHSLLLDGPDSGLPIFNQATLPTLTSFVDNVCWGSNYPTLEDAGASANVFFTPDYVQSIKFAATPEGNGDCKGNAECQTWFDRMTADYPHLTGDAAKVPILVWYANADNTLAPSSMQCVFNRLSSDQAAYTLCYDPSPVGHSGVVAHNADYVADWIAQKALDGGAPTEPCQALTDNDAGVPQLVDEAGAPIDCNGLLLNY